MDRIILIHVNQGILHAVKEMILLCQKHCIKKYSVPSRMDKLEIDN